MNETIDEDEEQNELKLINRIKQINLQLMKELGEEDLTVSLNDISSDSYENDSN